MSEDAVRGSGEPRLGKERRVNALLGRKSGMSGLGIGTEVSPVPSGHSRTDRKSRRNAVGVKTEELRGGGGTCYCTSGARDVPAAVVVRHTERRGYPNPYLKTHYPRDRNRLTT